MIKEKRSSILLGCGFLLMLLGSMPMSGFFGYLLWPNEFHKDPSTGWVPFLYLSLLVGVILWMIGIVLISLGTTKAWLVLTIGLVGIGGGAILALHVFFNEGDHKGALWFLATSAIGVMFAVATRMVLTLFQNRAHRKD